MGNSKETPTAYPKKKKKVWTSHDLNLIHERWLDMIDRYSRIIEMGSFMRVFYGVWSKSGLGIMEQIKRLEDLTKERWSKYRYYKTENILRRQLSKKS